MDIMPEACCHPQCHASVSVKVPEAYLCDSHLVAAYRSVNDLLRESKPDAAANFTGGGRALPGYQHRGGLVYFMRFGDRVKIGFTTNLPLRLQSIPHDELLATIPGTMADEKRLHSRFAAHRVHHEWFHLVPEILAHIEEAKRAA